MIDQKLIARINELSKISKERPLSSEEVKEQVELRREYLKQFKEGFKQTLDNVKVVDEKGNEVILKKKGNA
ncbi:MAG: DUF896 domain-containing protein [Candidatus Caccosoma sp.]|nr:DUF896 domain-containing protein [Candidatus Caccosoma sp.]